MTQKYQVKVSMKQAAIVETGIVLKQGDFGMQIEIEVLDFDATGTTPQIVFRKAMGAVESTTITVSGNKYTYTFKGTELDTPGKCFCDLKLKNSTTQRISTASFMFKVVADTLDGLAEEASSYSDTIEHIVDGFEDKIDQIKEVLGDQIFPVKGSVSDITVRTSIVIYQGIRVPKLFYLDLKGNMPADKFVIAAWLIDGTWKYVYLNNGATYDWGQDIKYFEVYVDPNKLSDTISIDGVFASDDGIIKYIYNTDSISKTNQANIAINTQNINENNERINIINSNINTGFSYYVSGEFTDVTVSKTIANVSGINVTSLYFHDYGETIGNEDVVIQLNLANNTSQYANLRNNKLYSYSSNIIGFRIYADANHLTRTFEVNGVMVIGNGIIYDLIKIYNNQNILDEKTNIINNSEFIYPVSGSFTNISEMKIIATISGLNISSIKYHDINGTIGNEDVVARFILADNTDEYVSLRNGMTYSFTANIKRIIVFAEANHLTKTFSVYGYFYTGEGLLDETNRSITSYNKNIGTIDNVSANINPPLSENQVVKNIQGLNEKSITVLMNNEEKQTGQYLTVRFILVNNTDKYEVLENKTYTYSSNIKQIIIFADKNIVSNRYSADINIYTGAILKNIIETKKYLQNQINNNFIIESARFSKWKMFTFGPDLKLIVLGSDDGINWSIIGKDVFASDTESTLRDPAVIKVEGCYYMVYSRILESDDGTGSQYPTGKYIGLAKSYDLLNWTQLQSIEFEGYYDMWAPEWCKNPDKSYSVWLTCRKTSESGALKLCKFDITNFDPFTYGSISEIATDGINSIFDVNPHFIKDKLYMPYSSGLRIKFAKMDNGIMTAYTAISDWNDDNLEGPFLIEMDGFYRMFVADHLQSPNTISYTDSDDLITWGEITKMNIPLNHLQHASIIYDDEWINHKFNSLL